MRILTRYLIVSNRLRIFAISNAVMLLVQSALLVALVGLCERLVLRHQGARP